MAAFFLKTLIAPSGETIARIKKCSRCKNGTVLLYETMTMPSMVGIVGHAPAVKEKSVMFFCLFVCLSRFGITKFVITETLWDSAIFKTIMVPLHRGRFLVVHLYVLMWYFAAFWRNKRWYSSFSMDSLDFFLKANLYQKLLILANSAALRPHF